MCIFLGKRLKNREILKYICCQLYEITIMVSIKFVRVHCIIFINYNYLICIYLFIYFKYTDNMSYYNMVMYSAITK